MLNKVKEMELTSFLGHFLSKDLKNKENKRKVHKEGISP